MRAVASLCAALALAGCAGSGVPYRDFAATALPVAGDSARLFVFRVGDTPQYAVRSASLVIDDVAHAGLGPGQFQTVSVAPGRHRIVVDMWDVPGRCELVVDVAGGTERYFEVSPRAANAAAMLPSALVPVSSFGTLLASGAVMMTGLTVESAGKACGGAFQVVEQPSDQAQSRLASLRASK
jgi:hypothetical protein